MGSRERNYVILDLLCGLRVSEVELIRECRDPLNSFLKRNVFLVWREEIDAQTALGVRFIFWGLIKMILTARHQALAEDARERIEQL